MYSFHHNETNPLAYVYVWWANLYIIHICKFLQENAVQAYE